MSNLASGRVTGKKLILNLPALPAQGLAVWEGPIADAFLHVERGDLPARDILATQRKREFAAELDRDLRVETFPRTNKAGDIRRYWQHAERTAIDANGHRRKKPRRYYGGPMATVPDDYWQQRNPIRSG